MPSSLYFRQNCPACGRSLQVRVEYLGRVVQCRQCSAEFVTCQPDSAGDPSGSGLALIERADELLRAVKQHQEGLAAKGDARRQTA